MSSKGSQKRFSLFYVDSSKKNQGTVNSICSQTVIKVRKIIKPCFQNQIMSVKKKNNVNKDEKS